MRSSPSTRRRPTCRRRTSTSATRCRTRRRSSSSATCGCAAATSSTRWASTTTACPTERYVEQKYEINKARTTRSEFRRALPRGDRGSRRRVRAVLAQARALGRLAHALLDDRRPLPPHRAELVPRPVREGPHLPVRGTCVLGSVDADVARAGRPRDDHAQLHPARHRVPRARRPRPRASRRRGPSSSRVVSRCTSTPTTSGTRHSPISTRSSRSPATKCPSSPTRRFAPSSVPGS